MIPVILDIGTMSSVGELDAVHNDVFKDVLNIMEKWSVRTKCNGGQNGGTAAHIIPLLRNSSNRNNAGISDCLHFPTAYTHRQAMYKKPWVGAQKILSHFLLMVFRILQTGKVKISFTKLLLGKGPG